MKNDYVIFVTVQLHPGLGESFRAHILQNAEAARQSEPGCRQFNVIVAEDDPDRYHFLEAYADAAALAAHRQTPHFKAYVEATKDMILERTVIGGTLIDS